MGRPEPATRAESALEQKRYRRAHLQWWQIVRVEFKNTDTRCPIYFVPFTHRAHASAEPERQPPLHIEDERGDNVSVPKQFLHAWPHQAVPFILSLDGGVCCPRRISKGLHCIIERVCRIVPTKRTMLLKISMTVATYPALW